MKRTMRVIVFYLGFLLCMGSCKTAPGAPEAQELTESPPAADRAWNTGPGTEQLDGGRIIFPLPGNYAESRPHSTDRTELTAVFSGEEVELDFRKSYLASEAQIFTALYEGLFSYHPLTLEPVPAAVSSWQLSENKKVWTFTIRENARFWNGDPLRAQDFRAAWLSMLDPAQETPYSSLFDIIEGARDYRLGKTADPSTVGITTPGERTLEVHLNAPVSFFPSMLCHHSFYPIHPSMLGSTANWSNPVSNGPFYVSGTDRNSITLSKNELYWDAGQVPLKKIILRFTDDDDESAAMWNSGEAHWVAGAVNYEALSDNSGIVLNPMFATYYFFIRSIGPWKDHRLRRAMALALPWKTIREGLLLPAKTLVYPISGYPEITGMEEEDAEEARRLLEEAGYPKGVGLPELVIRITPSEEHDRIAKLMAAAWMNLGMAVRLEVIPYNRYFQSLKEKNYNIGSTTWIGDFADPYTFLQMWRRDSNLNDALNDDQDYEDLMDQSMVEEGESRFTTLSKAEQLLLDRGTVLPIAYNPAANVVDTEEIDGWFPNALDIHPFKYFRFKAFKPLPGVARAEQSRPASRP